MTVRTITGHRGIQVSIAALTGILVGLGCATDRVTGKKEFNFYSLNDDVKLGQSALQANSEEMRKAGVPINKKPSRKSMIENVVQRISAVSDLPELPYTVTLYHTNIVNAAAAPGGSIFVFDGLFDPTEGLVREDDVNELAAVMAHEIAHVNCRHVTERLSKLNAGNFLTEIVAAIALQGNNEQTARTVRGVFNIGSGLLIPSYTRNDEKEADRVGIFYMARAGYDPRASPRIWKRAWERKGKKDKTSIFSTHPASKDRYQALTRMVPYAMEDYKKATGRYPPGYQPSASDQNLPAFDWRR